MKWIRKTSNAPAVICAASALFLLAACGSADGGTASATTSDDVISKADANVDAAYDAIADLPPEGGPAAAPDIKLLYLTAGLSSASGTEGAAAVKDAAVDLGWELRIFDGQFSPDKYQEGMRQAISWGADAVLLNAIDCPGNEAPLQALRAADIKVVAISSVDCNEGGNDGEALYDAVPAYPDADSPYEYFQLLGAAQADWIIAKSDGKAKVIEFPVPDFLITAATQKGFEERLAECEGCELVETIPIGVADFGPEIQDKAEQALLKNPTADYISVNYDDLMTFGIASAVKNSGRNDEIGVIAGNGYPANMDLIRENNGQDAGYAYDFVWDHMAGVDTVNRVLQGEKAGPVGPPVVLYDADHNLPPAGERYQSEGDAEATFKSNWG